MYSMMIDLRLFVMPSSPSQNGKNWPSSKQTPLNPVRLLREVAYCQTNTCISSSTQYKSWMLTWTSISPQMTCKLLREPQRQKIILKGTSPSTSNYKRSGNPGESGNLRCNSGIARKQGTTSFKVQSILQWLLKYKFLPTH
jgi:hypothetical protein